MLVGDINSSLPTAAAGLVATDSSVLSPSTSLVGRAETLTAPILHRPQKGGPKDVFKAPKPSYGMEYRTKQYGTDALISGGAIAAGVFIFAPEPIVTKVIGGSIALSCIAAGGLAKHSIYRQSFAHKALENALTELRNEMDALDTEIKLLQATAKKLTNTNQELQITKVTLSQRVTELQLVIPKLESEVTKAFKQLNKDRDAFEKEKTAKFSQLNQEIAKADSLENRAQERLDALENRGMALNTIARELDARRKALATSEAELREMQSKLVEFAVSKPETISLRPESSGHVGHTDAQAVKGNSLREKQSRKKPTERPSFFERVIFTACVPGDASPGNGRRYQRSDRCRKKPIERPSFFERVFFTACVPGDEPPGNGRRYRR